MPPRAPGGLEDNLLPKDDIDQLRRQNDLLQRRIEQLERENADLRDAQRVSPDARLQSSGV
jgi:cell division protein FtsB